jgi:hypothetical protein
MRTPLKLISALAVVATLAVGGVAIAADGATQITVEPSATLMPGQTAPFDAAGVRAIRRGKPIPAGYRLVGQKVTNTRGIPSAGAALFFRCPDGKRLKTFGQTGDVGLVLDRDYVNHRQTYARTSPGKRGQTMTGIAYAVCR